MVREHKEEEFCQANIASVQNGVRRHSSLPSVDNQPAHAVRTQQDGRTLYVKFLCCHSLFCVDMDEFSGSRAGGFRLGSADALEAETDSSMVPVLVDQQVAAGTQRRGRAAVNLSEDDLTRPLLERGP